MAQSIKHAPRPEVRGCTARRADSRYRARPGSARAYRAWLCSRPWGRPVPAACEGVGRPRQPGVERIPQQLRRYRLVDARTRGTLSYRALHRLRVLAALAFTPCKRMKRRAPSIWRARHQCWNAACEGARAFNPAAGVGAARPTNQMVDSAWISFAKIQVCPNAVIFGLRRDALRLVVLTDCQQ